MDVHILYVENRRYTENKPVKSSKGYEVLKVRIVIDKKTGTF